MPKMIKILNESDEEFVDRYDGQIYRVHPGESLQVPAAAGYLWMGDPALLAKEETRDKESKRVAARRPTIPAGVRMVDVPDEPDNLIIESKKPRRKLPKEIEEGAFAALEQLKKEEPPAKSK